MTVRWVAPLAAAVPARGRERGSCWGAALLAGGCFWRSQLIGLPSPRRRVPKPSAAPQTREMRPCRDGGNAGVDDNRENWPRISGGRTETPWFLTAKADGLIVWPRRGYLSAGPGRRGRCQGGH